MDTKAFTKANAELRSRLIHLLDTLSAVRALSMLDLKHRSNRALLGDALKILMQHHDLERCSVFLLEGGKLVCSAGKDFPELFNEDLGQEKAQRAKPSTTFLVGEGLIGLAAQTRTLQYCPACKEDERFTQTPNTPNDAAGSLMSAPILSGDTLLGVVNIYHPLPGRFEDWHRHILNLFCGILGHLLASHQVMQRLETAVEQRTRQLENALLEAQRLKTRYLELSTVDELTALHNRRFFFPEAEAAVSRAVRHMQGLCLFVLDLDHFKGINDTHGHAVGDRVLKLVADSLRKHTREGDILARFGGEEFIAALPNTELAGAKTLAERIRRHIRSLGWPAEKGAVSVSASIGLASLDITGDSSIPKRLNDLIKRADRALYFGKYSGRDNVCVFEELEI